MNDAVKKYETDQKAIMEKEWATGFCDRGHGHGVYGVVVKQEPIVDDPNAFFDAMTEEEIDKMTTEEILAVTGDLPPILVCGNLSQELAEHLVEIHNKFISKKL